MKKLGRMLSLLATLAVAHAALAVGWPANYEGVMLQAFYWDSYTDTRWTNLANQADELCESFDLIWVPNSGRCAGGQSMGYMPVYWFTNHNSSFGTEAALQNMISQFGQRGTGVIADVVVNHRAGKSNWTDFPAEEWNGRTWQLGPEHICSTDEVRNQAGQARPTGAPDTGEDFDGARDLDHTNATVQDNVKNYCLCLLQKYGYVGYRLDMVKGYAGRFTKIYNQYAKPQFCVGEYWDGSYDAVAAWIEATGRESAAFDFPAKYAMNEAFSSNNLTKLVWKANGTTDQPAGMIHYGYPQLAVTFIDNHDTYRDGYNKFNGNVLAANAFILCSPGTPCVFLPHWKTYKEQIKKMIAARKAAGVSNTSSVKVLKTGTNVYLAEVQGSKSKLAVRIGSTSDVPAGYTSDDLYTSGNGYAIWVKGNGTHEDPFEQPDDFTVYYDNSVTSWSGVLVHYWGSSESTWPGVNMTAVEGNIWKATIPGGSIGVVFNDGNGNQTADVDNPQPNHLYRAASATGKPECTDLGVYNGGGGDDPVITVDMPESLYILGNLAGSQWDTSSGVQMTAGDDFFTAANVEFVPAAGESSCFFNLTTVLAPTWDDLNMSADRYGASAEGTAVAVGSSAPMVMYANGVDASGCKSWTVAPGTYDIVADFAGMTLKVLPAGSTGIENVEVTDTPAKYFNLQGVRVANPTSGLYIVRRGTSVTKVYLR